VLQTTINILLAKLDNELTRLNLTSYDTSAFEYAVANATVTLADIVRRSTTKKLTAGLQQVVTKQAIVGNDDDGVAGMARQATRPPELANTSSTYGKCESSSKGKVAKNKRQSKN